MYAYAQVNMRFADGIRKPGEQTRLIITAAPGSLVAVAAVDKSVHLLKGGNELTVDDVRFFLVEVQCYIHRARNNGRSTDNVRTDWRVDRSTFRLAGHVVRSHSIVLKMK